MRYALKSGVLLSYLGLNRWVGNIKYSTYMPFLFLFVTVLLRHATVTELESPETPYIKRTLRVCIQ